MRVVNRDERCGAVIIHWQWLGEQGAQHLEPNQFHRNMRVRRFPGPASRIQLADSRCSPSLKPGAAVPDCPRFRVNRVQLEISDRDRAR